MKLEGIIEDFAEAKEASDILSKKAEKLKGIIKAELENIGLDEYESPNYVVTRTEINTDKLNQDALVNLLLNSEKADEYIKQGLLKSIFVLDLDKLESMCYNRTIDTEMVNSCIEKKRPTIRLNIKRRKTDGKSN